jgi:hypothetical protein
MKRGFVSLLAIVGLTALVAGTPAYAQIPAYTMDDTTGLGLGNPPFTLGSIFTANTAVTVTAIGVFDDSLDGLVDSYPVGLFDSAGNLLSSGTVSSGTGSPLTNQFRYANIAPVALTPGNSYEVGALYLDGNDGLLGPGFTGPINFATDSRIGFVQSSYASGGTLVAPLSSVGGQGYFGPNFKIVDTVVPEPGSIAFGIIAAGSLAGLIARKRKA